MERQRVKEKEMKRELVMNGGGRGKKGTMTIDM